MRPPRMRGRKRWIIRDALPERQYRTPAWRGLLQGRPPGWRGANRDRDLLQGRRGAGAGTPWGRYMDRARASPRCPPGGSLPAELLALPAGRLHSLPGMNRATMARFSPGGGCRGRGLPPTPIVVCHCRLRRSDGCHGLAAAGYADQGSGRGARALRRFGLAFADEHSGRRGRPASIGSRIREKNAAAALSGCYSPRTDKEINAKCKGKTRCGPPR